MEFFLSYMPLLISTDLGDLKSATCEIKLEWIFYYYVKSKPHLKSI